jgi:toxin-antitoxin system PIN domain toxin
MPDVNTLVAAAWPNHVHHELARRWLMESSSQGWASCPLVQSGFLRISMNARVVGTDIPFRTALSLLEKYTSDPNHVSWANAPTPSDWPHFVQTRVQGYRQVTDAMLLATVIHHDGVLATLDAGILSLLPAAEAYRVRVIAAL